jgi:hypothetical protein
MPMPLVKIGYLFIRTIAKPISSSIKKQAKDHPTFRQACSRLAQLYHRWDVRLRRRLAARAGEDISPVVRPLDEQKAIELGANFIGEALVFGVAGILLVADSARSHRAEMARRRLIEDKFEQLFGDVLQLSEQCEALRYEISLKKGQPLNIEKT